MNTGADDDDADEDDDDDDVEEYDVHADGPASPSTLASSLGLESGREFFFYLMATKVLEENRK